MSLPAYIGEMLFAESAHKVIKGNVGFIGQQATYLRPNSLAYLSKAYNVAPPGNLPVELDISAVGSTQYGGNFVTSRYLMKYLGAKSCQSIDISDESGADIAVDLCGKLPKKLQGAFDFIYDGSYLGSVFDPAAALHNMSRLLRPGGRVMLLNHATWFNAPYAIFSPGWYFDFFVANGYADCQVFLGFYRDSRELHLGPMHAVYYNWSATRSNGNVPTLPKDFHVMLIVLAEKGKKSTDDISPVQQQYRNKKYDTTVYRKNAERIVQSSRRIFSMPQNIIGDERHFIEIPTLAQKMPF